VQAPVGLGNLYLTEKRNEDAARWYARAIGIDPRNMSARCNLAGALANQGKYEEAVTELEAALRIDPNHPIATERLKLIRQYLQSTGGATGTAASP
jgi:tetratricopeptide (TPR) repeat protein